ncbi:MAG: type II secretion system protein [Verrucomicrobia bacterium]|nr:type II secretion system protein [Verrucomicrobiota bacterium]
MKKRQSITLLEIMIVIFLIGLIGGVVGYNMSGSLDRGRAFKTDQMSARAEEILELEMYTNKLTPTQVKEDATNILFKSGLFKDRNEILKDGWGQVMKVDWNEKDSKFVVMSEKNEKYKKEHRTARKG